jgi:hypothetical protein
MKMEKMPIKMMNRANTLRSYEIKMGVAHRPPWKAVRFHKEAQAATSSPHITLNTRTVLFEVRVALRGRTEIE